MLLYYLLCLLNNKSHLNFLVAFLATCFDSHLLASFYATQQICAETKVSLCYKSKSCLEALFFKTSSFKVLSILFFIFLFISQLSIRVFHWHCDLSAVKKELGGEQRHLAASVFSSSTSSCLLQTSLTLIKSVVFIFCSLQSNWGVVFPPKKY